MGLHTPGTHSPSKIGGERRVWLLVDVLRPVSLFVSLPRLFTVPFGPSLHPLLATICHLWCLLCSIAVISWGAFDNRWRFRLDGRVEVRCHPSPIRVVVSGPVVGFGFDEVSCQVSEDLIWVTMSEFSGFSFWQVCLASVGGDDLEERWGVLWLPRHPEHRPGNYLEPPVHLRGGSGVLFGAPKI